MKIYFTHHFKSQLKKLKKKYPKVNDDLLAALETINLEREIYIGKSIYKIRIKSRDQKKGKSGGFRAYIFLYRSKGGLIPLCIYPKTTKESITENELMYHLDKVNNNLNFST